MKQYLSGSDARPTIPIETTLGEGPCNWQLAVFLFSHSSWRRQSRAPRRSLAVQLKRARLPFILASRPLETAGESGRIGNEMESLLLRQEITEVSPQCCTGVQNHFCLGTAMWLILNASVSRWHSGRCYLLRILNLRTTTIFPTSLRRPLRIGSERPRRQTADKKRAGDGDRTRDVQGRKTMVFHRVSRPERLTCQLGKLGVD